MKCLNCDNESIITKSGKQSNFCTMSCRSKYNSIKTLEKRKQTNIEKYGVENPSKNKSVIELRSISNIEKYGVENPFSLKEIQEKQQQTMISRYGSAFATQIPLFKNKQEISWDNSYGSHPWANIEVRHKRNQTMLERYGVEHPILNEDILIKIRETSKNRYGNEIASKTNEIIEKIRKSLLSDATREKTQKTCIEKYGATSYQLSLIPLHIREILDNSEEFSILINSYGICGLSELLNISIDVIRDRIKKFDIQISFKSGLQQEVLEFVKSLNIEDITIDTRKVISPKELDLYFEDRLFAIEVNGSYWHSELNGRNSRYHLDKMNSCINKGISIFFVWEHLWNTKKDIIKSRISSKFNKLEKIYARNCQIKFVSSKEKEIFLDKTHLQGNCKSSVNLGVYHNNELVSIMTFGRPRFNKSEEFELLRFSSKLNTVVVGGASKLFKHFVEKYSASSVISYSDRQYGTGNVYSVLNFNLKSKSTPSYQYTRDYINFENRLKYQKHKLEKILPAFDKNLTEWQNMQNNGFDRIWDCGNDVWIWKNDKELK